MKILNLLETFSKVEASTTLHSPTSRRAAFSKFGDIAIDFAKVAAPFGIAALAPVRAHAQMGNSVVQVLNFALLLEYLEAEYYETGLDNSGLLTGDVRLVIEQISQHENAHVDLLSSEIIRLGGTPRDKPDFDFTAGGTFPDVFSNQGTFLAVAQAFEDTGVRAYKGQAGFLIDDPNVLTVALQIHSVEARHAAKIRRMRDLQGWIPEEDGIPGVPAAQAVYDGEANVTHLGLDAVANSGGVGREAVTEAYDEPLTEQEVTAIASMFLA